MRVGREVRRAVGLLLVCLCCALAAEIEGVVLDNLTGRPLARARVILEKIQGSAAAHVASAFSDSRGRYAFRSLAAGAYLISARRAGYMTGRYGQRRWDGAGTPVVVDAHASYFAELRLHRLAVITGQVFDENRIGLPSHPVYAYRTGERPLRLAGSALTDDRGVYRIAGLEPGTYYVRTGPRQLEDGRGLLPTFYGQSLEVSEARVVQAELDRETAGIDIEPLPGRLTRLGGRVSGGPAGVTLYSEIGQREVQVGLDGAFHFEELAPGSYQIVALSSYRPLRAAWRRIIVPEGGAEVTLELARLPSLFVRCVDKDGGRVEAARVTVFLRRRDPPGGELLRAQGGQSIALVPGEYEVAAVATPEYYIQSLQVRQWQPPGAFEAVPGDSLEMTVLVGTRPAAVIGKVLDAEGKPVPGAPVFLTAVDPQLRALLDGGRQVRADQNGEYRFEGLAPGRYRLFASFEVSQPREADWDAANAVSVDLQEGHRENLDLKLAGGL